MEAGGFLCPWKEAQPSTSAASLLILFEFISAMIPIKRLNSYHSRAAALDRYNAFYAMPALNGVRPESSQ
jgi:hypothetical protein